MYETHLKWAVLGVVASLVALPAGAEAQVGDFAPENRIVAEVRGGGAFPISDLGDLQDPGYSAGAAIGYRIHPRITLRADADVEVLSGVDAQADGSEIPDMRLWHYGGGAEVAVLPAGRSPLSIAVSAGAGATTFDTDQFPQIVINPVTEEREADFNEVFFTANGGLKVAYRVSERVDVFAGGKAYLSFVDEDETALFSELTPEVDPEGFDTAWSIPVQGGVRVTF